jgi:thiol-disulfide isomerase/thioredoxin
MSATRPKPRTGSSRGRRQAEMAAKRRRRRGFAAGGVAVLAVAGAVLGLHYANRPSGSPTSSESSAPPSVGKPAPAGTFTTLSGQTVDVASVRGHPTLVWFVSTWCSSCQAGTQTMAQNVARLQADGVKVDEVELYQNLGQSGPSMTAFANTLAGPEATNPDWTFGTSSASLTRTYDPQSYLDIYYLLNAQGDITYVNGSPGSTMPQLLAAAGKLA